MNATLHYNPQSYCCLGPLPIFMQQHVANYYLWTRPQGFKVLFYTFMDITNLKYILNVGKFCIRKQKTQLVKAEGKHSITKFGILLSRPTFARLTFNYNFWLLWQRHANINI